MIKKLYKQLVQLCRDNSQGLLLLIGGSAIIFLIRLVLATVDTIFAVGEYPIQRIIFVFSSALLVSGLEIGYTKLIFNFIDSKPCRITHIFNYFDLLFNYFVTMFLLYFVLLFSTLPVVFYIYTKYGFELINIVISSWNDLVFENLISSYFNISDVIIISLLFFIPIIYLSIRFSLSSLYVIDKKIVGKKALIASWNSTAKHELYILLIVFILLITNILGAISIIGLLFTIPASYIVYCLLYRHLNKT